MHNYYQTIHQAAHTIKALCQGHAISNALVLGSGLNQVFNDVEVIAAIDYADIPGMKAAGVESHQGQLVIANYAGNGLAICKGRLHLYEGHSPQQVAFLSYVLSALGANQLIVSNAAGSLNPDYQPADIMLIKDHINLTGHNPIIGQDDSLGSRFADMSDAYTSQRLEAAVRIGQREGIELRVGVYLGVQGPSLETSAERRMMRAMGADAVGMSTVMEVIAANHRQMDVLGISVISNRATGEPDQKADTIEEVLNNVSIATPKLKALLAAYLNAEH